MTLWLIGAGPMAQDYAKVLNSLEQPFEVIGRSESSATTFRAATGHAVRLGGVENALRELPSPDLAIVAVGVEQLAVVSRALIEAGTRRILLEKPGGIDSEEINRLQRVAAARRAEVLLAYNRRFYASTLKAKEYIEADGGLLSAQFEFTEWSHKIGSLPKAAGVKERWLLGNSTHVIDLAFHFCGVPADWCCWHAGSIDWHPAAARFCGAGVTTQGVLFSYLSDWQAPGRWGLELLTSERRLILRPMEQLQVTLLGDVKVETIELEDTLDREFKPGLCRQTEAFLNSDDVLFCTLDEQVNNMHFYLKIAGYQ